MRYLSRWHFAESGNPSYPIIALATAFAMVGALILDSGIIARTPEQTASPGVSIPVAGDPRVAGLTARDLAENAADLPLPAVRPDATLGFSGRDLTDAERVPPPAPVESVTVLAPMTVELATDGPAGFRLIEVPAFLMPALRPAAKPSPAPVRSAPRTNSKPAPLQPAWRVAPIVTWYGVGFYGNRTACGQIYTRYIVGVAHRTLPCGTLIEFRWHGMTYTAPVIDRGPYATKAYVFDFSAALACDKFRPKNMTVGCFTRYDVQWRIVGRRSRAG